MFRLHFKVVENRLHDLSSAHDLPSSIDDLFSQDDLIRLSAPEAHSSGLQLASALGNGGHIWLVPHGDEWFGTLQTFSFDSTRLSRLAELFDQTDLCVTIADLRLEDGPLVYVSPGFEQMTGYLKNDVLGKNCRFLQGPDTGHDSKQIMKEALEQKVSTRLTLINYKQNGEKFFNDLLLSPLHDSSGNTHYFIGIQHDLTEVVVRESQLHRLDQKRSTGATLANIGIIEINFRTGLSEFFPRACDFLRVGVPFEPFPLTDLSSLIVPEDREEYLRLHSLALAGEFDGYYATRIRVEREPGELRTFNLFAQVHFANDRSPHFATIAIQDVSNELQLMEQLRESDEFNRGIIEASIDCVKLIDLDGKLLSMNKHGQCIMEIDDFPSMCGSVWLELWPQESQQKIKDAVERAKLGQVSNITAFCPTAKGTPKWWNVIVSPVCDSKNGSIIRILSVSRDITELVMQKEAIEKSNREKEAFLATLSHELRNPLSIIQMQAELLEQTLESSEELTLSVETVRRNVKVMSTLIDELLDLKRIELGKLKLELDEVDLNREIRLVEVAFEPECNQKGVTLTVETGSQNSVVSADSVRLNQVFSNIIRNALKFTPSGGSIHVSTKDENNGVLVQVKDNGHGIKQEALQNLFNAFYQAESGLVRQYGGLGLGLAIAKGIVEQHEGWVSVASEGPGKGATFTVWIPSAPES